ncbi:uncharacterized protein BDR25DRAFT_114175 [Lindgomyces ingoldianus]|uniref:Uncharacterized protein n=1 Tax=Lindgomyces ingoldianus TaxID=673940 RepID=A0ACB6Q8X7_9PLEO|nr:uncharacterized protein BDR25DRAFT_114175 [Lindgomyces ingoldianus]KAF2463359.1 hypothetical protein BDR25DRAFT_114175 [Lindgomyces ingoldianus]
MSLCFSYIPVWLVSYHTATSKHDNIPFTRFDRYLGKEQSTDTSMEGYYWKGAEYPLPAPPEVPSTSPIYQGRLWERGPPTPTRHKGREIRLRLRLCFSRTSPTDNTIGRAEFGPGILQNSFSRRRAGRRIKKDHSMLKIWRQDSYLQRLRLGISYGTPHSRAFVPAG